MAAEIARVDGAGVELFEGEALRAHLAEIERQSEQHVDNQTPANTKRGYADDWRVWCEFTRALGVPETTATPGVLVLYVVKLDQSGAAYNTVSRRVSGVMNGLREHGVMIPAQTTKAAWAEVKRCEARHAEAGRTARQAAAVTVADLRRISAALPDTLAGTRDRALLLIGFAIAARRSELAALNLDDITDDANGIVVRIRKGKTGSRTVAVPLGSHEPTCPVRAWRSWVAASGITDGSAWRHIDRHGNIRPGGISADGAGDAIHRAGALVGLTITGHSLRAGLATEARRAGHDVKTIAATTGHRENSRVIYGYMRIVDRWSDNALKGIGL